MCPKETNMNMQEDLIIRTFLYNIEKIGNNLSIQQQQIESAS